MQATTLPGEISANSLYTLSAVKERLGLGVHAMRTARRRGLIVHRIGRRGFVLGRDLIEYVEKNTTQDQA